MKKKHRKNKQVQPKPIIPELPPVPPKPSIFEGSRFKTGVFVLLIIGFVYGMCLFVSNFKSNFIEIHMDKEQMRQLLDQ